MKPINKQDFLKSFPSLKNLMKYKDRLFVSCDEVNKKCIEKIEFIQLTIEYWYIALFVILFFFILGMGLGNFLS